MSGVHITNRKELARTAARVDVLDILEAGLAAIDTDTVLRSAIHLNGNLLSVRDQTFPLDRYRNIHVIGFGKVSCVAAATLADILGSRITRGVALGTEQRICRTIDVCEATHPMPSMQNVALSERIVQECASVTADDLVLVIVSGGGSAMLCWPNTECVQAQQLYEASMKSGLDICELNTVRKHLSALKGGGLAKALYPATVIGLIFSDIPGGKPEMVASGPTYFDASTREDAQAIIDRFHLGEFQLTETPKDPALFQNITNIVLVSNQNALEAMRAEAMQKGYTVILAGANHSEKPEEFISLLQNQSRPHTVLLAGGELMMHIPDQHGSGGRNQQTALTAATMLTNNDQVFAALASDGRDNGPHAGGLVDADTLKRIGALDISEHLRRFDATPVLQQAGDLIETGPTGSNVADLMVLLQE